MSKLDFQIGDSYQYRFAFGDTVTGTLIKTKFFGTLHLIEYRSRWDYNDPIVTNTRWIGRWRAYKEFSRP